VARLTGDGIPIVIARPGCDGAIEGNFEHFGAAGRLRLLFVGSCVPQKGIEDLIEALALIRDLPLLLELAGNNDIDPRFIRKLMNRIQDLGLQQQIFFHGLVDPRELGHLYASADIFIFPSHYEGYGIALAEAMKAGLPIVAAQSGPVAEILADKQNALIVPKSDPEALAMAIRTLAEDSALRERFGRRSRELSDHLPSWRDTGEVVKEALRALWI
jgi:glycosyltransferase involved in cell wall biosynthesis